MRSGCFKVAVILMGVFPTSADAAEAEPVAAPIQAGGIDAADTAWMLTSSALVLMMTAPGLALFYGGLVRKKNILSVLMQCMFLMGLMSVVWALWGYSLAFGDDILGGFVGGSEFVFLSNVLPVWNGTQSVVPMVGSIPRALHMMFQMMFFIITPALICGAFAERMKFSTMCVFSVAWGTLVYCPLAHWVWSDNGWCNSGNVNASFPTYDFAGGVVVHLSSGLSALLCCLLLGKRLGYGSTPMPPHNLTYTCIGTALLWVGWFGFNAVEDMVHGVAPFPHVRDSLQKLSPLSDMIVCSATPNAALQKEWDEHNIAPFVAAICGQEAGSKKETLGQAAACGYAANHVLMIGDAPGDMQAAQTVGALFYPINPGAEEASWERFFTEACDRFLNQEFAGDYQAQLIAEFDTYLPEHPPWKTDRGVWSAVHRLL